MSGQKTARKMDTVQEVGWRRCTNWIQMWTARCGRRQGRAGVGLKQKKDTPAARFAR